MQAEPGPEHQWLQRLVGSWSGEMPACEEGQPPSRMREQVRPLGALWVLCEGEGSLPDGSPARMLMTLGYDTDRGHFVGSWVGSMMTTLWVYDGHLDAEQQALTLEAEGPVMGDPDGRARARYRDIITFESDDHRTLTSCMQMADGRWQTFMTAHYYRRD